jgi:FKBP-type peptidyl-prolyl cis-trans isomerase FklB
VVHYRGALVDGTEVDGSIGRGEPVPLALARTILGWRQALVRMPVGSRWELVVPPRLAYGRRAVGPKIGPYATLVFEIELLSIRPKEPSEGKLTRVATPERRDGATVSTP